MLTFPAGVRLYLAIAATDLRRSFDGLSASVQSEFGMAPTSGDLFIFLNRRASSKKSSKSAPVDFGALGARMSELSKINVRRRARSCGAARLRHRRLVRQLRAMAGLDPRAVPFADFFEAVQRDGIVLWEEKTLNGKGRFLPEELSERRDRVAALLRARRLPFSDIARAVGVTPQFVYAVAKSIGVPPPTRRRS